MTVSTGTGSTFADEQTITLSVSGSATAGTDYTISARTLTLPAGAGSEVSSVTATLTALDDNVYDDAETIVIGASRDGATFGTEQTVTIADDEGIPAVTLVLTPPSIAEDGGTSTVTATVSPASATAFTVDVTAAPVSPAEAGDFQQSGTTLSFAAGETLSTGLVTIAAVDNTTDTPDRQVSVSGTVSAPDVSAPADATLTILDDDTAPVLALEVEPATIAEDGGTATVTVTTGTGSTFDSPQVITLVLGGTATQGEDYTVSATELTLPRGEASVTATVTGLDDRVFEGDETLLISGQADGAAFGEQQTLTITDNEAAPRVTLVLTPDSIGEDGGTATVTATATVASAEAFTVTVAATADAPATDADFTLSGATLSFAANATESTGDVTIAAVDNGVDAADKTLRVSGTVSREDVAAPADATLTIADDDEASTTVTLTVTPQRIDEGAGATPIEVTVALDAGARESDTVIEVSLGGAGEAAALQGVDYTPVSDFSLTIPANETSAAVTFTLTPIEDRVDEPDETLTLTGIAGDRGIGVPEAATLTLADNDDVPELSLRVAPASIAENGGTATVTVTTGEGSTFAGERTVALTLSGTATEGEDYRITSRALTLPPGSGANASSVTATLTAVDDNVDDDAETIVIGASRDGAPFGTEQTVTIADDEGIPAVTLVLTPPSIAEDGGTSTVTATVSPASATAFTVDVTAAPVSPAEAGDFQQSGTTLSFAAGATVGTGSVTIAAVDNTTDTPDRQVSVSGTVSSTGVSAPADATLTILDDETAPVLTLEVEPATIAEDGGTATVTVTTGTGSTFDSPQVITLVLGGTATQGEDYTVSATELTLPRGEASVTATVTGLDDRVFEGDETLLISGQADGAAFGEQQTLTITDNEAAPRVTLVLTPDSIGEDGGTATVTATATVASAEAFTVTVAATADAPATDADFTLSGATLSFAANATQSTGNVTIAAVDNGVDAADKTLRVSGTVSREDVAAPADATLTIADDDEASTTVTLTVTPQRIDEGAGATPIEVTVALDAGARESDTVIEVSLGGAGEAAALQGVDYTPVSDFSLTIPANETSAAATFTLTPIEDRVDEPDETLTLTGIAGDRGIGVPEAATLTLADNDDVPELSLRVAPASIAENGGTATVTVTTGEGSTFAGERTIALTLSGTATEGEDYRITSRALTLPPGSGANASSVTATLTAVDDAVSDQDETIVIGGLLEGVAFGAEQTVVITDNEGAPRVTLVLTPGSISEDGGVSTVTATVSPATAEAFTVTVAATADAPATDADFTLSGATLSFAANATESTGEVTIAAVDNDVDGADKTVRVSGSVSAAGIEAPADATLTIADDDEAPSATSSVTLVLTPGSISEDGGVSTVTATVSPATAEAFTVTVAATADVPATDADFTLSGATLSFAANATESTGEVTIAAVDNDVDGADKTVHVSGSVSAAGIEAPADATLTIADDDEAPGATSSVTLVLTPSSISEDGGVSTVTATVSPVTAEAFTVTVAATADAPATDADFTLSGATLSFAANATESTGEVTIAAVDNDVDGADKTVRVSGSVSAAGIEAPADATLTIADDDEAPSVTLVLTPSSISEDGGVSTVTATVSPATAEAFTVTVAATADAPATDADFTLSGATLSFAANATESTGEVTIAAVDNDVDGADKTVHVSGSVSAAGIEAPADATLTIADDDEAPGATPSVTLVLTPSSISEDGGVSTVTATVSPVTAEAFTVTVAATADAPATDADFTLSGATLSFAANATESTGEVTIAAVDNDVDGADKTVRVSGSVSAAGIEAPADATLTIQDDETAPVPPVLPEPKATLVLTPESIREDGGSTTVTATLDSPSTAATTITVTATPVAPAVAGDFRQIGTTLTIPIGATESTGSVTIEAVDNEVEAPNKRVTVSATTENDLGVEDPPDRTLTITDNEFPSTTVTLSVSPSEVQEGASRTVTVMAELDGAARTVDTDIAITVAPGTAAATDFAPVNGFTLTIPAQQKSGTAMFSLDTVDDQTDEPDETVRVTGTTSGLTVAPSGGVTVTIGDDDSEPRVTLELSPASISENGGSSTVTAVLDRPSTAETVITVTATPVVPAVTGDFLLRGTGLTIPAGQTESTGSVTIASVNNELSAPSKQVAVSGAAENARGIGQPQAVNLTITDDDRPSTMVTLTVSPDRVAENGGATRLVVTGVLDGAPESADTVVTLTVNAGAAEAVEATLTIPTGQRSATAALTLTPVDNAIDNAAATATVNAATTSSLTLNPASLTVTITDDDERGVTVSAGTLRVIEGPDGRASYTVVLGSQPTSTVTVTLAVSSQPPGANLSVSLSSLSFTASDWNEPQTVTVTAEEDQVVEEDAAVEVTHRVRGGDYGANNVTAASVTVTVLGFEESDGRVTFKVPMSGDPVVTVPEGTAIPARTRVTLPSGLAGGTVEFETVADDNEALTNPPRGFRTGDAVLDIELNEPLLAGQTATVCLPASSGNQRVHRYDDSANPPEWVELAPPAGGSPPGLACGVTDSFSLFALGSAPNEMVAEAWLPRFGRTAAQHVLDGIRERLSAPRTPGFRGKLAGHAIGTYRAGIQGDRAEDGSGRTRPGQNGLWQNGLDWNDDGLSPWRIGTWDRGDTAADSFHDSGLGLRGRWRPVSQRELITGTAFAATGEADRGSYTIWGRGMHTQFDGPGGDGELDGRVTTATLGSDWSSDRWIAGLSLSHSKGRGGYLLDGRKDRIEASVTGLYPYAGYKLTDRFSVWGATGYGKGELSLTPDGGEAIDSHLNLWTAAAGARADLLSRSGPTGPALALETDALFVRTWTAAVSGAAGNLAAVAANASRLRLKLDGSWALAMENETRLTPSLEVGVRHDSGDAENGFGLDLGGGLAYALPARGFAAEFNGRWLLAHQDGDSREWGMSGSLRYDPRPSSERGLSLSVTPSVGILAKGGANTLFGQGLPAGAAANDNSVPGVRLTTELGYGFSALGGTAVQIPWAGWSLTESGGQTVRLGWRLKFGPAAALGIEASRFERPGAVPDHRIGIALRLPLGGGATLGGSGKAPPD